VYFVDLETNSRIVSDLVDSNQKFMYANELIAAVRDKTSGSDKTITVFAGGYPETLFAEVCAEVYLNNLKRKVGSGVNAIITQVIFSAEKFVEFVKKCRKIGIPQHISIIPGLYIPRSIRELDKILALAKTTIDPEFKDVLMQLEQNPEAFNIASISYVTKLINDIQETSPEFIRGFHFFTMNNFELVQRLTRKINFSEK